VSSARDDQHSLSFPDIGSERTHVQAQRHAANVTEAAALAEAPGRTGQDNLRGDGIGQRGEIVSPRSRSPRRSGWTAAGRFSLPWNTPTVP